MTSIIDPNKCMSLKNKTSQIQCPNKRHPNCEYCGIHKRSQNVVRIDQYLSSTNSKENKVVHKKIKIINSDGITIKTKNILYTMNDILNCKNFTLLNISDLIYTINRLDTKSIVPLSGPSQRELFSHLVQYYEKLLYYLQNIDKIIKIQAVMKGYLTRKRRKCINDEDCFTLDNKYEIPQKFYFDFTDHNGYAYCFDIRTFMKIVEQPHPQNPYTMYPIDKEVIQKFYQKLNTLMSKGVDLCFEKPDLTTEQEFTSKMVDIFHEYDVLNNYTDHRWFENLSLSQLKELYKRAEDTWNYRSQLTHQQKCLIVKNGEAFDIPVHLIYRIKHSQKRKLQNIILDEFKRFACEGSDINEKKLGAMLMLSVLVEVSQEAALALPHLVQI